MENFFSLRAEKQDHIINAALTAFGRNGYKKTSTADIAEEAGIAKGMVFYYFGSKKNLYLYLVELCGKIVMDEMDKRLDRSVTDFFNRIKMMTDLKISVMKRHPAILSFLTSVFYETDAEVADEVKEFLNGSGSIRGKWVFDGTDVSRLKEDIDPKLLDRFLVWAGEGCINDLPKEENMDAIDALANDFNQCLDIMKRHFYRDEIE